MIMNSSPTINAIFLIILCSSYPCITNAANFRSTETDREALVSFRAGISSDPFGFLNSWNDSIHFCQWPGVRCIGQHQQRVISLVIPHQKLSGSLSPYIGNLSFLRDLSLMNNSLTHEIPHEFGRLHRLQFLYLNNNSFTGDIPTNLSACVNLEHLSVAGNNLRGKIPVELGSLSKLILLFINDNYLTGGIPLSFGNISSLVRLNVARNNLGGSLPSVLGKLKSLQTVGLSANSFSGVIPFQVYNLSSLTALDLGSNEIHGSLPPDMGILLPNLKYLAIFENHFVGTIPPSVANMSNLTSLDAGGNKFTGKVPTFYKLRQLLRLNLGDNLLGSRQENDLSFIPSLSNATDLKSLSLFGNNFGGNMPESLGNFSGKLLALDLSENYLSGNLPAGIGYLVNLQILLLFLNHFTGKIPPDIWKVNSLRILDISQNMLSGKLSPSIGNLSLILQLFINNNDLHGAIPSSVGNFKNLLLLDLSDNNFNGTIPKQVFDMSPLSLGLDLSNNRLSGLLPNEVGNMKNLERLYIFDNMLSGEIPSSLGSCASMELLNMYGNYFQGSIPSSLSSLKGLQVLHLAQNNLSGEIPNFLGDLDLIYLNLSFNNFEGAVPSEGIFKNSSAFFVHGNSKLCGGIPELKLPLCPTRRPKKWRPSLSSRIIILAALGLLVLTSALGILLYCWLRKKKKDPQSSTLVYSSLTRISFQSLVNATDRFASTNLIGIGSFGSVYRGMLEDGKAIAVKVLDLQQHGALKSFMAECEALRNIRHRNLVSVVSACSGIDYQGNDFKAVVYELMVNGSLEEWLHSVQQADAKPRRHLNLLQRLNIAVDVAIALDYLHNHSQTPVVHCDLKPSNVLLDNDMIGHVGDFGLARIIPEEANILTSDRSRSVAVYGTVGYAPPEYGAGSEVSVSGDIYSYGILLLEMFTGKKPTDDIFHGNMNLHEFAKLAFSEGVIGVVDPTLLQLEECCDASTNSCNKSSGKVGECLISILKIGVACSMESPRERMDINIVAAQLQVMRNDFMGIVGECVAGA